MKKLLAWHRWRHRRCVIHIDGSCPSLSQSEIPDPGMAFNGSGTKGWLTLRQAIDLEHSTDAKFCGTCVV